MRIEPRRIKSRNKIFFKIEMFMLFRVMVGSLLRVAIIFFLIFAFQLIKIAGFRTRQNRLLADSKYQPVAPSVGDVPPCAFAQCALHSRKQSGVGKEKGKKYGSKPGDKTKKSKKQKKIPSEKFSPVRQRLRFPWSEVGKERKICWEFFSLEEKWRGNQGGIGETVFGAPYLPK